MGMVLLVVLAVTLAPYIAVKFILPRFTAKGARERLLKANVNIIKKAEPKLALIVKRTAAIAKERGLSNAEAKQQLVQEFQARMEALCAEGMSHKEAEQKALADVFDITAD